ncbi:MAG TPA: CBS domain-containing protein, partial [Armatimonadetes bacterium]|nr:CBS domain-containing protein [Armatimonadota bacterium]
MIHVGELARSTTYLAPDDPVGKAAEHLRQSPFAALPVVQDGHVIGMVFEEDVFDIVYHGDGEGRSSTIMDDASTVRVR